MKYYFGIIPANDIAHESDKNLWYLFDMETIFLKIMQENKYTTPNQTFEMRNLFLG